MREPTMTIDALAAWQALLGRLNALGQELCTAIEQTDLPYAIATMIEMRRARSALALVDAPEFAEGTAQEHAAIAEVVEAVRDARASEEMMRQWLARPMPPQRDLLQSALGVAVLADAILPVVWDFEADLVILVGAELAPVAQLLVDIGQRRIALFGAQVPGTIELVSVAEIAYVVHALPTAPSQVVVHAVDGSVITEDVRDAVEAACSALKVHRNTMHAFSRTWLAQAIENAATIAHWPSVLGYDGLFAGIPMVIVAPGPSLAKNAHLLPSLKGRAIITAFSHSLQPVLAAGVVPDLVITVDPQDVRYHFVGCDLSKTTLVNGAAVHPSIYELPARRFITMSTNGSADAWMYDAVGEYPIVPGGGSVATTALSLALRWKCDPIVFMGLDLSFPGGKYYVATSCDGEARAKISDDGNMRVVGWSRGFQDMKAAGGPQTGTERVMELPGWDGGVVPSNVMFSQFHRWFEDVLRNGAPSTIYNCTEGGCRIKGMVHVPLASVEPTLTGAFDIEAILAPVTAAPDRAERFALYLQARVGDLITARKLARRLVTLIEAGAGEDQLAPLEKSLAQALRPLGFVSLMALREVERAQDIAHRDLNEGSYRAASESLMRTLVRIIDEVLPLIERATDRLSR